jgi:hypothetical protein
MSPEQIFIGAVLVLAAVYVVNDIYPIMFSAAPAPVSPQEQAAKKLEAFEAVSPSSKPADAIAPAAGQPVAPEPKVIEGPVKPEGATLASVPPSAEVVPRSIKYLENRRETANLEAGDLLPDDTNSAWSNVDPAGQGSIAYKNWLEAGYHQGVNTIGSSLKNASRDLRAEPINPQQVVSPWMQSTVEPDLTRRPLEDGEQA